MTKSTNQHNSAQHKESLDSQGPSVGWAKGQPQIPFSQIANEFARSQTLSCQCTKVLLYLMSHIESWEIRTGQLIHYFKGIPGLGRDGVLKALAEACKAGYMRKITVFEGNLKRTRYEFARSPVFKESFPRPEFQGPEEKGLGHIDKNTIPKLASKLASHFSDDEEEDQNEITDEDLCGLKLPPPDTPTITLPEAQKSLDGLLKRKIAQKTALELAKSYTYQEIGQVILEMDRRKETDNPVRNPTKWTKQACIDRYGPREPSLRSDSCH